jgi:anti-sigma factor RsiW
MEPRNDNRISRICNGHRKACDDRIASLDLYVDGEICHVERAEIDEHLGSCAGCRSYVESRSTMRESLRSSVGSPCISTEFRARLEARLREAQPACVNAGETHRRVLLAAAGAALAATAGLATVGTLRYMRADDAVETGSEVPVSQGEVAGQATIRTPIVSDAVRWHRRDMPVEITGPDQARVSDWFVTKVEFPVRAPEFTSDAILLGGRIGNVQNHDAAYLLYEVNGSKVSVLLFEAEDSGLTELTGGEGRVYIDNSSGYNVGIGQRDGVGYAFTSDLPSDRFAALVTHSLED